MTISILEVDLTEHYDDFPSILQNSMVKMPMTPTEWRYL